jgi:hypothetical protein
VEEAPIGKQSAVMGEPDENGFVEERVRLQAEVEPLENGDQPEQNEDRKKRDEQENR